MDWGLRVTEALCGRGCLLTKPELTEDEKDMVRAAEIKALWLDRMMAKGLAAQLAFEGGVSVGFIEYMPVELSNHHKGQGLYRVNCLDAPHTPPWAKSQSVRDSGGEVTRIPGCGRALVEAMIEDVKDKCNGIIGASNIAYSDTAGFFTKLGFEQHEAKGQTWLIRKFAPFELPERVTYENRYQFQPVRGKVVVDTFWSSHCTSGPWSLVMLRDVCQELGDRVVLNEHCVDEPAELEKYGVELRTYFNGQSVHWSYQLSKDKIRELLDGCVKEAS